MTVSLAPRVTVKRSREELKALAEQGNLELGSLTDHEASPAEVVAWVARNFGSDAAAVACSMADAALPHLVAEQLPEVPEDLVAHCVAVLVVHRLEVVDVAEQHRALGLAPHR